MSMFWFLLNVYRNRKRQCYYYSEPGFLFFFQTELLAMRVSMSLGSLKSFTFLKKKLLAAPYKGRSSFLLSNKFLLVGNFISVSRNIQV